jgi:dUTP pyrophosphatase
VNAGVVDSDYRGEIKVIMYNPGTSAYRISPGDKIAQLIFERIYAPADLRVQILDVDDDTNSGGALSQSSRGDQGFGSTERNATTTVLDPKILPYLEGIDR